MNIPGDGAPGHQQICTQIGCSVFLPVLYRVLIWCSIINLHPNCPRCAQKLTCTIKCLTLTKKYFRTSNLLLKYSKASSITSELGMRICAVSTISVYYVNHNHLCKQLTVRLLHVNNNVRTLCSCVGTKEVYHSH